MKKTLLIVLLLIPFIGFSQTTKPIEGFLGVKFGSSKKDVLAAVQAKGGVLYKDTTGQMTFTGINLGNFNTKALFVQFIDNQAYAAQFVFKDDLDDKTIDLYNNLVNQINDVYGAGKQSRDFRSPYKDGDGYEITAIEEGDADYLTTWKSDNGSIKAFINPKLYIYLIYQDKVISAMAAERQKQKAKGDF